MAIPLSSRVPGRASGPSRSRVDDGGGLRCVSGKLIGSFRFFPSGGLYRRRGSVRGWTRVASHIGGAARGWAAPPYCVSRPPGPSPSPLRSSGSFVKYLEMFGFCFVQFREYFLCNFSETQKQQKTGNWHCGILLIG